MAYFGGPASMSDSKTTPSDLDLLIASMDDLAREIGEMEPDDPVRAVRLKELYALTELSKSLKTEGSKIIHERMDALRR
jgi:tRNA A37 N6-isopentenylltransferase MiaA